MVLIHKIILIEIVLSNLINIGGTNKNNCFVLLKNPVKL